MHRSGPFTAGLAGLKDNEWATARIRAAAPYALLAGAWLLWWLALRTTDPNAMNDLGLVSVLSPAYYVALGLLVVGFALSLRRRALDQPVLWLYLGTLILILHGTPAVLYGTVRYTWTYKHLAIIDYIQRHGTVDPSFPILGVYHDWPGFFALGALWTEVAGLENAMPLALWAPVAFQLLNALGIMLVLRTLTRDRRLMWLAAWFFVAADWVGQEYFSPQAFGFFLYVIVLGVVLGWFGRVDWPAWRDAAAPRGTGVAGKARALVQDLRRRATWGDLWGQPSNPLTRAALMAIVVLMLFVIASSHQLTPFMAILALGALAVIGRLRIRFLPVLMVVLTAAWAITIGAVFLGSNLTWIVRTIGQLSSNVNANLIDLSKASAAQVVVAAFSRGLTLGVAGLAALGVVRRVRRGYWDVPALVLAASPLPMLAGNGYGGEILFRIYLFALPFLAFFAAGAVLPMPAAGRSWRATAAVVGLSAVMLGSFAFAYYGKERVNYIAPNELAAVQYLGNHAPRGALLVDMTWGWSLQYRDYEFYTYRSLTGLRRGERASLAADPAAFMSRLMGDSRYSAAYFVMSKGQTAFIEMASVLPPGGAGAIESALRASPQFRVVYENPDAVVFQYLQPNPGGGGK